MKGAVFRAAARAALRSEGTLVATIEEHLECNVFIFSLVCTNSANTITITNQLLSLCRGS